MTQIQTEISRLHSMVSDLIGVFPEAREASIFLNETIPGLEKIRATGGKEIATNGVVSGDTYNAMSAAMASAEDEAWSMQAALLHTTTKMVCRQLDNIHIMLNAIEAVEAPERLKCWPPGSNC